MTVQVLALLLIVCTYPRCYVTGSASKHQGTSLRSGEGQRLLKYGTRVSLVRRQSEQDGTDVGAAPESSAGTSPETEPETEPKATPKSEATAETEPENSGTPESSTEPETEPEAEPESWPEPGPQWDLAFKTWKSAWQIHVYSFAVSFLFMALYSAYFVIFNVYDGLNKKFLSLSLNIMVLVFCMTRSLVLFLDPYHQGGVVKAASIMRLLWSLGGPCLTAADSLIILALLEMSRLTITSPKLQKRGIISVVVIFHFVFVAITDFVIAATASAKGMILFCQIFYVVWGGVLGTGYFRLGYVLDKKLFGHKAVKEKADKLYVMLIYASGAANYLLCVIMIYTGAGVFGVYSDVTFVDPWHWWVFQTLFRLSEVITCILIFTVSAKRTRVKRAMDENFSTASQVSETSGLTGRIRSIQQLRVQIMARFKSCKVEEINIDRNENAVESETEVLRSARGRKMSMFSAMQSESMANVSAMKEPARPPRRMSMFSAMNEAAVASQKARAPAPTTRRLSMFSAMQDANIRANLQRQQSAEDQETTENASLPGNPTNENDVEIESLEPGEQTSVTDEVNCKDSLRKPRGKFFFGFPKTRSDNTSDLNKMEDIIEESEFEFLAGKFGRTARLVSRIYNWRAMSSARKLAPQEKREETKNEAVENAGFTAEANADGLPEISKKQCLNWPLTLVEFNLQTILHEVHVPFL